MSATFHRESINTGSQDFDIVVGSYGDAKGTKEQFARTDPSCLNGTISELGNTQSFAEHVAGQLQGFGTRLADAWQGSTAGQAADIIATMQTDASNISSTAAKCGSALETFQKQWQTARSQAMNLYEGVLGTGLNEDNGQAHEIFRSFCQSMSDSMHHMPGTLVYHQGASPFQQYGGGGTGAGGSGYGGTGGGFGGGAGAPGSYGGAGRPASLDPGSYPHPSSPAVFGDPGTGGTPAPGGPGGYPGFPGGTPPGTGPGGTGGAGGTGTWPGGSGAGADGGGTTTLSSYPGSGGAALGGFGGGGGGFGAAGLGAVGAGGPVGAAAGGSGLTGTAGLPTAAVVSAGEAGAGAGGGARAGIMPMHGGGSGTDSDRERTTWLEEDEDVWGAAEGLPPVLS